MGFSDTATYVRVTDLASVEKALTKILGLFDFVPSGGLKLNFVPSYHPLDKTPNLLIWIEVASKGFIRLYSSHSGIFTIHTGDHVPILQKLAKALKTDAFEISVNDGDSICVLESNARQSRLTGCHSYVLDEIFEKDPDMVMEPGTVHRFKGVQFPYQNLEISAEIVPELIGHDFGFDMESAIVDFEKAAFGKSLPSYYDFVLEDPEPIKRKHVFGYKARAKV